MTEPLCPCFGSIEKEKSKTEVQLTANAIEENLRTS